MKVKPNFNFFQDHPYIFTNVNSDVEWNPCVVTPPEQKINQPLKTETKPQKTLKTKVKVNEKVKPVPELFVNDVDKQFPVNSASKDSSTSSSASAGHVFAAVISAAASVAVLSLLVFAVWMQYVKARKNEGVHSTDYSKVTSFENPTYEGEEP